MKIDYINIRELVPYKNNPRKNDQAVDQVIQSIKEYGFRNPIIIDENNEIIAGHTRYKASVQMGLTFVPCIQVTDLTEDQKKGYRIADNRTGEFAEWDYDLLKLELQDLNQYTGFNEFDMENMFFEEIAYKEKEEKNKATELKIKFKKPEHVKKLEDELNNLFKKYDDIKVQIYSGEI